MAQDPAFISSKEELAALVRSKKCREARLVENAGNYSDLAVMLDLYAEDFNCQGNYIKDVLAIFPDDIRLEYGIFYDKTGNITDPFFVSAGVHTDIIIETSKEAVYISGTSANRILVRNNSTISYLLVANGSHIINLEVEDGSTIDYVAIKNCGTLETSIDNVSDDCYLPNVNFIYKQPLTTT